MRAFSSKPVKRTFAVISTTHRMSPKHSEVFIERMDELYVLLILRSRVLLIALLLLVLLFILEDEKSE